MIARIFVYLLLMIVFPCLYVDMRYLRRKRFGRVWVRVLWWLPGFCMAVYTVILAMHRDFAPADTTVLNFYLFLLGMLVVPNFVFALCSVVGLGVKKDLGQAARLYRQAIRAEESLPVYGYLGELLEAGAGGEPDPAEILDLYRTGAAKGDAVACLNLGRRCQRGDGVKKNEKKALDLYRKAGGAGYAALASCFRLGIGAERDMREAAAWYRKDAEEGGRTGMLWLALLYLRGDGVRKNRPRAEELCRRAADIQPGVSGMYKAGRDMEPGTYRLTALTSEGGSWALYNDVRYYYDYIDGYGRFAEPTVITVEEGQYLELTDVRDVEKIG